MITLEEDAKTEAGRRPPREPSRGRRPGDFTWTTEDKSPRASSVPCGTVPSSHSKQPGLSFGQPRRLVWSSAPAPDPIAATLHKQQEALISQQQTLQKEFDALSLALQGDISSSGALKALAAVA